MRVRLGKEKVPYVTRVPHWHYPAGTKCLASRPDLLLTLEFEDGLVLVLDSIWYAEGLEYWDDDPVHSLMAIMNKQVQEDIDREVRNELELTSGTSRLRPERIRYSC